MIFHYAIEISWCITAKQSVSIEIESTKYQIPIIKKEFTSDASAIYHLFFCFKYLLNYSFESITILNNLSIFA